MQRTEQGVDAGGDRREQVGVRGTDEADRGRRTVLLVVGVQDQQLIQGPDQLGVDLVGLGREAERHPQEVLDQRQGVVRVQERVPDGLTVGVGGDGGQLGQQPDGGQFDLLGVERVERVLVEGRQRADRAGQHRHRVRVPREAVEEPLEVLVQHRVPAQPVGERLQLGRRRQLAVDEQVAGLDEGRLLGQLLDRVAPVAQDAGVTVDVGDLRGGGTGVGEARIQGDHAQRGQQLGDLHARGALGGRDHLQLQLLPAEFQRAGGRGLDGGLGGRQELDGAGRLGGPGRVDRVGAASVLVIAVIRLSFGSDGNGQAGQVGLRRARRRWRSC